MRINHSEYRPVADLTLSDEVMDRAARLKETWTDLIEEPSFRQMISFNNYGLNGPLPFEFGWDSTYARFHQVKGQVFDLITAIRRRVSLPALDGYVVEKGKDGPFVAPHFDRGEYPLYVVHFGEVAPTVVYSGKILEEKNRVVVGIDGIPLPIESGQVMKLTPEDYHFRQPTDPLKQNEVRQLFVFTARGRGDWIRRLLNWTI